MNKYLVEKLDRPGNWVSVKPIPESFTEQFFPNIIMYSLTEEQALEINMWVEENKLGQRMSFDQWKLKSSSAVTAFRLKWS